MALLATLIGPDRTGAANKEGSGYYIGDDIILTAGHVVYRFNEKTATPPNSAQPII